VRPAAGWERGARARTCACHDSSRAARTRSLWPCCRTRGGGGTRSNVTAQTRGPYASPLLPPPRSLRHLEELSVRRGASSGAASRRAARQRDQQGAAGDDVVPRAGEVPQHGGGRAQDGQQQRGDCGDGAGHDAAARAVPPAAAGASARPRAATEGCPTGRRRPRLPGTLQLGGARPWSEVQPPAECRPRGLARRPRSGKGLLLLAEGRERQQVGGRRTAAGRGAGAPGASAASRGRCGSRREARSPAGHATSARRRTRPVSQASASSASAAAAAAAAARGDGGPRRAPAPPPRCALGEACSRSCPKPSRRRSEGARRTYSRMARLSARLKSWRTSRLARPAARRRPAEPRTVSRGGGRGAGRGLV